MSLFPRFAASLALCALAGCAAPRATALEWPAGSELVEIARLEDARSTGGGRLIGLASHRRAVVRERAVTALGRLRHPLGGEEVTRALLERLYDDDAGVRAAAAFGLGMRKDPAAADKLLQIALDEHTPDPQPSVRARAIEAASKLERPDLRPWILFGLRDSDAAVRIEAAVGAHRWPNPAGDEAARAVDETLVASLVREREPSVVVALLFSLQRRHSVLAADAFVRWARDGRPEERIYAVRGLRWAAPETSAEKALIAALNDEDWRVAAEAAVGLADYEPRNVLRALMRATKNPSPHVRRSAWTSLGSLALTLGLDEDSDLELMTELALEMTHDLPDLLAVESTESPSVRAATLEAELPLFAHFSALNASMLEEILEVTPEFPEQGRRAMEQAARTSLGEVEATLVELDAAAVDGHPVVVAGYARALGKLRPDMARVRLERLAHHDELTVAEAALEALGGFADESTRAFLVEYLGNHEDNGLRLAAVLALTEMADESTLAALERAYDTARGDIGPELRFNVLRVAGKVGTQRSRALLTKGSADADPFVRQVAGEQLASAFGVEARPASATTEKARDAVPLPGVDFPRYAANPRVDVVTTRGTMTFELFPGEAPVHVHGFLTLAGRNHYDGLPFHRVVPDFVIQGGDHRGDGNGGTTWRGVGSLRHEIGPRKYVRGSLGMPRNEDWDSGGSQIFVTHRSTPHLDGRYTIFGELRAGFEVLDAIEVGDRILDVRRR